MKKIITAILVFVCMTAFLPAAYAGDTENSQSWFQPTFRVGVGFDPDPAHYEFSRSSNFLGYSDVDLDLEGVARPYFALELPFSLTDRFKVSLKGDWSFTSSDGLDVSSHYKNTAGGTVLNRTYETDDTAHWVSLELLGSYAFLKDVSFVKDVSLVAGVHWDYFSMDLDNPEGSLITVKTDWSRFRMQTLAPLFGFSGTFKGFKKGAWGGDMHISALAGPILWGHEKYKERINNVNTLVYKGDDTRGYILKFFGDVTILSGKITPTVEGSVALFVQFTKNDVNGDVKCKDLSQPLVNARHFDFDGGGTAGVIGLSGAISF